MPRHRFVVAVLVVVGGAAVLTGCGGGANAGDDRPVAVATAPQIDGLLRELAGDGVRVETVVPATADVHELELRPSQVRALRDADLVLRPGRENDAWAQEALDQLSGAQIDVAAGLPGTQRHWWMDPTLAGRAATKMAGALDELDPAGAPARRAALRSLTNELAALDRDTQRCLATVPAARRKIVTDHDAAGAYAERYGLTVVGTISPGSEPEAAPSAKHIAELEALMAREGVAAVFPIAPHGSALAGTVAERAGAKLGEPLWADALPGASHAHDHGETSTTPGAHAQEQATSATLQAAARLNGEAVAEALGADETACSALLG